MQVVLQGQFLRSYTSYFFVIGEAEWRPRPDLNRCRQIENLMSCEHCYLTTSYLISWE